MTPRATGRALLSMALLLGAACVEPSRTRPPSAPGGFGGGSGGAAGSPAPPDASGTQEDGGGSPGDAAGGSGGGAGIDAAVGGESGVTDAGAMGPSACPELVAGWTAYQPGKTVQRQGGESFCEYRESGGVEFFRMTKNPANVVQRCEARVANDYTSGRNQFEGEVRVTMGDATCVHQVFKIFMLDAFPAEGGQLRHYSGETVVSGVYGKWVHVNTVHDVAAGRVDLYIDCVKKGSWTGRTAQGPRGYYNKYGLYGILGEPPRGQVSQAEWRNVRYYRR